jgi:hypothetical protein
MQVERVCPIRFQQLPCAGLCNAMLSPPPISTPGGFTGSLHSQGYRPVSAHVRQAHRPASARVQPAYNCATALRLLPPIAAASVVHSVPRATALPQHTTSR